jgi:hypothetical protein
MPKYKGREVSKDHFRAYVYGDNNTQMLVNSWDDFQYALSTGAWFEDKPEPKVNVSRETSKLRKRRKS